MRVFEKEWLKDCTFDEMMLDGKTLKLTVGWDGDFGTLIGLEESTGRVYVLKTFKRPA